MLARMSLIVAAVAFATAIALSWAGKLGGVLGIVALGLTVVAGAAYLQGRRGVGELTRQRVDLAAKLSFTIGGLIALLRHPIGAPSGGEEPLHVALVAHLSEVEPISFAVWALAAMAIKLVGVIASAWGWHLLLRGQGIRVPFWQTTVTGFLIGRFIGTFLPSTLGLDGYTLWEIGRVTGAWHRTITAKAVEKLAGSAALFLGIVVTLPVAHGVFVTAFGDRAPWVTAVTGLVSVSVTTLGVGILVFPAGLRAVVRGLGRLAPARVQHHVDRLTAAVVGYRGQVGLMLGVLGLKFGSHFLTAIVYWCTALAIGVSNAAFWPIVAGSLLQILGTVLAPTIGGEGAREALQALLLTDFYDQNPAKAVLAAALGFVAAEAATLWGGAFLWTRTPAWRPSVCEVDGVAVDVVQPETFDLRRVRARLAEDPQA